MNEHTITVYKDSSLEDIIQQLEELGLIKHPSPVVVEYRCYYNDDGMIIATCSNSKDAEQYGFTGNYIIVDKSIYDEIHRYRIINDKPVLIPQDSGMRPRLKKSDFGFRTIKNNVCLLLEDDDVTNNSTEFYNY